MTRSTEHGAVKARRCSNGRWGHWDNDDDDDDDDDYIYIYIS